MTEKRRKIKRKKTSKTFFNNNFYLGVSCVNKKNAYFMVNFLNLKSLVSHLFWVVFSLSVLCLSCTALNLQPKPFPTYKSMSATCCKLHAHCIEFNDMPNCYCLKNFFLSFSLFTQNLQIWLALLANFLTLWVWEGTEDNFRMTNYWNDNNSGNNNSIWQ